MAIDRSNDAPTMEEPPSELVPCGSCGRKFRPDALERHTPICVRSKNKPKQIFDIKSKRREAIIQDNNVDNAYELFAESQPRNEPSHLMPTGERVRRNSFIDPERPTLPSKGTLPPPPKHAPLKRKPADAPRGGPPKPKPEPSKPRSRPPRTNPKKAVASPSTNSRRCPLVASHPAPSTNAKNSAASRSRTPSRGAPKKRATPSADVNGNDGAAASKTPSRNSVRAGAPAMRRAISSPHIETNNNSKRKEGPVVKFKEKFPNHVNPNLDAFSAVFNKAQGQGVPISIRKPRTVPGVRTGGHSGVEFADPELLKRPASSIELDSGWDSKRFTEDYVLRHSPRAATGGSMTDLRGFGSEVCSKCNSPFLVSTAKFCFNCGDKRL